MATTYTEALQAERKSVENRQDLSEEKRTSRLEQIDEQLKKAAKRSNAVTGAQRAEKRG